MKLTVVAVFLITSYSLFSQTTQRLEPFSESKKAIASVKYADEKRDSLRKCYKGRWTIDFTYGQRFIDPNNRTNKVDSITQTDFTRKRAFYGIGTHYFITQKVQLGASFEFLFLPRVQEITSFNGSGGSGEGNGGLMFSANFSAKYSFTEWGNTRPYIALALGRDQLVARGGTVEFSLISGRDEEINKLDRNVFSANLSTGLAHRLSPGSIFDFNFGYSVTSETAPIGGITSPGGIKASISLQFVLNPN